jgi:Ig-like domain CHU_C associated
MKKNYLKFLAVSFALMVSFMITPSCNHKNEKVSEQESEDENDEYDGPDKAADFETFRTLDVSTGKVPYGKFWNSTLETESLKNNVSNRNTLAPLTWVERGSNTDAVGPSNGNTRAGNEVTSGRMRAVWVDLADPTGKTVWVGGVSGGLWKTNDISAVPASWTLINDYLSNLAIASICQDPSNTNIMYFSTGESYRTGGGVGGVGVFKSIDHGITWNLLTNPSVTVLVNSTKILCDNAGNVYVNSQGISIAAGLQRSSDGGNTWVSINPFTTAPSATSRIIDFEISSTGAMHIVGGFFDSAPGIGGYRYTANPATCTSTSGWNTPTSLYPVPTTSGARVEITTAGNTIYAAISSNGSGANTENIDKIAKSIDGGDNWTTTNLTAANITDLNGNGGGQGTYSNTIGVDPSNPNNVIVGSLNLLKSTDGGVTFSKLTTWFGFTLQYLHADQHNITWYDNGNKMLVGSDGGLFYSVNKGTSFLDKNVGLRLKQFYGVSIHPTSTDYFLAGAQDNGTHQFNGPGLTSSVEVLGGDGGFTGIDQDEPQFQSGAYVYANFRRSSNSGATWSSSGSANTSGLFINPYDYDNVGNKVYAGYAAGQFLRWEDPHSAFTFTPVTVTEFGTGTVTSTTVSPTVANRVYFGVFSSKIFKLDNADIATPIVTDITPIGIQAATYISCVTEGLASNQNLLATQSRTTAGFTHVWSSINGGSSWVACDGNLPNIPVYWAVYHPDGDTKAYIATETGVWSTDALNGTSTIWIPETTFPTVKTSMLKYRASDRTIAAATYGRGLWTATIPSNCTPASISTQPANTAICAGSNTSMSITATGTPTLTYQWQLSTTGAGGPWNNITANATYSNVTTATLNITAPTVSMNTYQYRCVVTGNCAPLTATSNPAILTVNAAPAAPTVISTVTYCQGATATALTATGTNLLWYTTATGGTGSATAPTPSTAGSNTIYYVSQTVNTCESPRASITVIINAIPPSPSIITTSVSYCQGATATPLVADFSPPGPDPFFTTKWFTVPTGGTALPGAPTPSTTTIGSTVYYVSLTNVTCEGPRQAVTVTITAVPAAPTVTAAVTYCQGVTATALTATGSNLLWYTAATGGTGSATAPIPSTGTVGITTYYVSQTTGCESPRTAITVTVIAGTPAPIVTTPVTYCQGTTAITLTATGTNLLWYTAPTGGTGSSTAPTPSTTAVGTTMYYVSQTSGTCESPRAAVTVNVTATPTAPIVTTPVTYCQNATAIALTATGTNLKWYTTPTGGVGSTTAPIPTTITLGATIYYVSQTTGTCEGPRAAITVNVLSVSPSPTVITPVNYCQNSTSIPLTATGTNLLWYTSATGGTGSATPPTPSTTTTGSTIYYVTQNSTCGESARTPITVNVNPIPPAPTATITFYTVCQNETGILPFSASGSNLLWYNVATGGTGSTTVITPSTATPGVFFYYVSQTIGGCESPRTSFRFEVVPTPPTPIVVSPVNYCQNAAAIPLTATGTNTLLLWYTTPTGGIGTFTPPTPTTTVLGSTIYYVSQLSNIGNCQGPRAAITVNVLSVSPAPTVITPVTYCQNSTATALTATGTNLLWYTSATGGTGTATAPTPSTTTAGSTTYYVTQNSTCGESARTPIIVTVNPTPVTPTVATLQYCQGATAAPLTATGINLLWYSAATGGTGSTTAPTPVTTTVGTINYYVSQTILNCESPRASLAVTINATPNAPVVTTPVTYCLNSLAIPLTATGTNLKWYTVPTGGTALANAPTPLTTTIGSTTYYVSQSAGTCEGARAAIVVNVTAVTAPPTAVSPIAYCQGSTATALSATGTNLLWYTTATGGTGSATAPIPSTTTVGSTTYYVSQTGTCESTRTAIVVNVTTTPVAPTATSPIGYCQGSPSTALIATGTNLLWYTVAAGGTGTATAPTPSTATAGNTTYYVSQSVGTCEGPRAAIVVNISAAPSITTQPQDITSCATSATFTVAATGTNLTYQWYVSTDGGTTYNPIGGATSSTFIINGLTPAQSNYKYRAVVSSGTCTAATSNAVSARVGTNPVVVLTAAPTVNFNPYTNGGVYTTVSPAGNYTYQWKRNNIVLTNTGTSITRANGLLDDFGSYIVTVTDVSTGCSGISNALSVSDVEAGRNLLYVFPNPTTGLVKVSFYSSTIAAQGYNVNVYDEKGTSVISKNITFTGRYGFANVDLTKFAGGNYIIILKDAAGKKVASSRVVKY